MDINTYLSSGNQSLEEKDKIFNLFQTLENYKKYNTVKNDIPSSQKQNSILCCAVNENFDKMSDEELKYVVTKCMNIDEMKKIILGYELRNIKIIPENMTLGQFGLCANNYLRRYQFKAGGFTLGDNWKMHDKKSKKYKLHDNELVFENTVHENYIHVQETYDFLANIIKLLNSITKNIKVTMHTKFYERDRTHLLILKCVEKMNI